MTAPLKGRALTKTTAPRLPEVLQRHRLFERLDRAFERPAVWVSAPAGAGKTILALSYLQSRDIRPLWYQMDPHDRDLAALLQVLRESMIAAGRVPAEAVPELSRAYHSALPAYAERLFTALTREADDDQVLVFDDCHMLANDAAFFTLMAELAPGLPPGIRVMFLSREEPPPGFAKLRLKQHMDTLDWESLRFTREECERVGRLKASGESVDAQTLDAIYERTRGWVAGMVLMFERPALAASAAQRTLKTDQVVFDYLSGEIFDPQSDDVQRFLLRTAFLDRLEPQLAAEIADEPRAAEILAAMARGNHFTTQLDARTFEYHPLLRDFLRHRAGALLGAEELTSLKRETAIAMQRGGDTEGALERLFDVAAWDEAVGLLLELLPTLIRQGRYHTAEHWLGRLPPAQQEQHPWLVFWLGAARQPFDRISSRHLFENAYAAFKAVDDTVGRYHAWAAVMETYFFMWMDLEPLAYWLEEFNDLRDRHPHYPSRTLEARTAHCLFSALFWRSPDHDELLLWRDRVEALLDDVELAADLRTLMAYDLLFFYAWFRGDLLQVEVLIRKVEGIQREAPGNPFNELMLEAMRGALAWVTSDSERCLAVAESALEHAEATGVHLLDYVFHALAAGAHLNAGRYQAMHTHLDQLLQLAHVNAWHYHSLSARALLQQGHGEAAREHAELCLQRVTSTTINEGFTFLLLAQICTAQGRPEEARERLDAAYRWVESTGSVYLRTQCMLCEATLALKKGNERKAADTLAEALRINRQRGFGAFGWRHPDFVDLLVFALCHGIEAEQVRELVAQRGLTPSTGTARAAEWPWPLAVRTLGVFTVECAGTPVAARLPGKPAELLQAIIAHGRTQVPAERIADALWPDADGDSAQRALETTLHRLRKALADSQAVSLRRGLLGLDEDRVWVDTGALESLGEAVQAQLNEGADIASLEESLGRLRRLQAGPFLPHLDHSWVQSERDRLERLAVRLYDRLGQALAERGAWVQAAQAFELAIELAPTEELHYSQLIQCYAQLGDTSRALSVYQRCRENLGRHLEAEPSAAVQAQAQRLQ